MLRPAVAATNCARGGENSSGFDIGRRRLSVKGNGLVGHAGRDRSRQSAQAGGGRQRRPENSSYRGAGISPESGPGVRLWTKGSGIGLRYNDPEGVKASFWPALPGIHDKTSLFPRISKPGANIMMMGAPDSDPPRDFASKLVGPDGYLTSRRACRHGRHLVRLGFRRRHDHDADHDPVAGIRHPHQSRPDRDRDPEPQLSGRAWCSA